MATSATRRDSTRPDVTVDEDVLRPGIAQEPTGVPAPVAAAAAALFGALSRLRGGSRSFHPDGLAYEATLRVDGRLAGIAGVPLLEQRGEHRAIVRFSRALGLPGWAPDVLGLAVRLVDVHGRDRHQDFLLVTSVDVPILHHLLLPGMAGFLRQPFSSLLTYRLGGPLRLVTAVATAPDTGSQRATLAEIDRAAAAQELRYDIGVAAPLGRMEPFGTVAVGRRLPDAVEERLAFTPWNTGGGFVPAAPFMGVRRAAYAGSQRGRGLGPGEHP